MNTRFRPSVNYVATIFLVPYLFLDWKKKRKGQYYTSKYDNEVGSAWRYKYTAADLSYPSWGKADT